VSGAVVTGHAYGRRATLELSQDTLTWRAQRGSLQPVPENIVTTVHDVRGVRWLAQSWSLPGGALAALGLIGSASEILAGGALAFAAGAALLVHRRLRPRLFLVLDVGDRRLVMQVAIASAAPARTVVARIKHALASGEPPATPPTLP
jgi:hypothetical protein